MGGTFSEARTWFTDIPFHVSPQLVHVNPTFPVSGSALGDKYLSNVWYHLQVALDAGNRSHSDHNPVDWGYFYANVMNLAQMSGSHDRVPHSAAHSG